MAIYWKFKIKGSRKFHLSKESDDGIGPGKFTLCGLPTEPRYGVRTISMLDRAGDECPECVEVTVVGAEVEILIAEKHFWRAEKKDPLKYVRETKRKL
jgi:hypothetical protein